MAYLYLILALAGGLIKGISGKSVSRDVRSLGDGFSVNIIRSAFCSVIGLGFALIQLLLSGVGLSGFSISPSALLVCLVSSFCMALFSISWLYAYQSEAYVFLNVFTMLASILTGILGRMIYGDELKPTRIIGFAILLISVYILSLYNKKLTGKITRRGALTLLLGSLGVALSDFCQKIFSKESFGEASVFTFYTYFLMLIPQIFILLILCNSKGTRNPALADKRHNSKGTRNPALTDKRCKFKDAINPVLTDKRHILIFFIMSAALYMNSLTKTLAAKDLPATQMYPTLQGANLIASAILASIFFGEKITKRSVLGIAVAIVAVLFMNI